MQAMSDNLYANKHVACRTRNDADRYGAVRHSARCARCVERRRSGLRGKELRGNAARGSELRGNGARPHLIPERYGRTDRQICYIISRVSMLTRDKNRQLSDFSEILHKEADELRSIL